MQCEFGTSECSPMQFASFNMEQIQRKKDHYHGRQFAFFFLNVNFRVYLVHC